MTRASASLIAESSPGISSPSTPVPSAPTGVSSDVGVKQPSADSASTTSSSADAEVGGDLGDLGGAAQLVGELAVGAAHVGLQLLDRPGRADHPAEVAELPLDLALHGDDGVGEELHAAVGVEVAGGLEQRHRRGLGQVVVGDPAAAVAGGDRPGQAHVQHDDLVLEPLALDRVGLLRRRARGAGR